MLVVYHLAAYMQLSHAAHTCVAVPAHAAGLSSRPHPITPEASQHGGPTTTATAAAAPASGPNQQQPAAVSSSPYSIPFQAQLVLGLARHLQLSRVLLVGHADGCLVAVAAATAAVAAAGGAASGSGSSSGGAWGRAPGVQQMTGRNGGSAGAGGGGARGVAAGPDLAALDLTWMASLSQVSRRRGGGGGGGV
jgi:pimeloyl-ACP methyl ester carboxylesterase